MTANSLIAYIDQASTVGDEIFVSGWVVHATQRINSISFFEEDMLLIPSFELLPRPDLQQAFPTYPGAYNSGFKFQVRRGWKETSKTHFAFKIVAYLANGELETLSIAYVDTELERQRVPIPPEHLQVRVRGSSQDWLRIQALIYHGMKAEIEKHRKLTSFERILDWGCGCGGIMRYLLDDVPAERIYGCDIDSEAIGWNKQFFIGPSFTWNIYQPPTPYESEYFDLIYGISIFTHLSEPMQFQWLKELRRLLKPGGIIAVSLHGEAITPGHFKPWVAGGKGFFDTDSEQRFEFAAYATIDYYRSTFHTRAYVMREWSKYFRVLDYIERGINGYQDLVILTAE
ncbi:MAG: class I SAM-dependent methyltransferase [Chloroflexota bacterium]